MPNKQLFDLKHIYYLINYVFFFNNFCYCLILPQKMAQIDPDFSQKNSKLAQDKMQAPIWLNPDRGFSMLKLQFNQSCSQKSANLCSNLKIEHTQSFSEKFQVAPQSQKTQSTRQPKNKKISKNPKHQEVKLQPKSGIAASNINRKLIKIIEEELQVQNLRKIFYETCIRRYELKGQKENIIFLPFLCLDFFIQNIPQVSCPKQNLKNQVDDRINKIKQTILNRYNRLERIFLRFKTYLQETYSGKVQKVVRNFGKLDNFQILHSRRESNVYIDSSNYFGRKIPELFLGYFFEKGLIVKSDIPFLQKLQKLGITHPEIKLENVLLHHDPNKGSNESSIHLELMKDCMQKIEDLFDTKQRESNKAKDKFVSIQLSSPVLKLIFGIQTNYKLQIKETLEKSFQEQLKRQNSLQKKNNKKYMDTVYQHIDQKVNRWKFENAQTQNLQNTLGEDFLMALMAISLLKRKNYQILNEFIESIERQIEFMSIEKGPQSQSLLYGKQAYKFFIGLLSRMKLKQKRTSYELKQWIYPLLEQKQSQCKIEPEYFTTPYEMAIRVLKVIVQGYQEVYEKFQMKEGNYHGFELEFH